MYNKEYSKTGIKIGTRRDEHGLYWFDYGINRGSEGFKSVEELQATIGPWIEKRRKELVAEAAELERIERFVTNFEQKVTD